MQTSEFTDEYGDWLDGDRASSRPAWLRATLSDLRRTPALIIAPNTPIHCVVDRMNRARESAVLVVESRQIVGIFTERDVLVRVVPRIDGLFLRVSAVMTERPTVMPPDTNLGAALRELALGAFHHLPVVDPCGGPPSIVSLRTIVSHLVETFPEEILNAPPYRDSYPPERYGG